MALELEEEIMREIGLGQHYSFYNGSGSCEPIRRTAVSRLKDIINKKRSEGKKIAPPNLGLIKILEDINKFGEESQYSLTNTWHAISYVIAEHIHQAKSKAQEREEAYDRMSKYLKNRYLPKHLIDNQGRNLL